MTTTKQNTWYQKQFGKSSIFGKREDYKKGNYGTGFWGKNRFTYNKKDNVLEKAKLLQSVRNFVKILTRKDIPVRYSTTEEDKSFTDGKSITISGNVAEEYDPIVGLALHESSHIVKTNFDIKKKLYENPDEIMDKKYHEYKGLMSQLLNWVEDRRIDNWAYNSAPGYKIYYQEMYEKYFESDEVNKILESKILVRKENVENYMYHLINITNPRVQLDELKGLREIWDVLDLKQIDRLKNTQDSLDLACKIFDIIKKYVPKENMEKSKGDGDENNDPTNGDGEGEIYDGPIKDLKPFDGKGGGKPVKLGPNALNELKELLKKQKDFLKGKIKKETVDKNINNKINALIESESSEIEIKEQRDREFIGGTHKVITVNNVTMNTINSGIYVIFKPNGTYQEEDVKKGLILGTMLGRKLQIRQEERTLVTPRLNSGKIDKRRLAGCGYGSSDIFFTNTTDKYGDISVHISLDLSSSMNGDKWTNTMISAIAIAKAASMTKGIRVQISLRYSDTISGNSQWSGENEQAIVINFYDSKINKPNKLKWFKYVSPEGCTPEGLCFEALMIKIMKPLLNKNSLFINYSDGYPGMNTMGREEGVRITKKSINKIRNSGVEVLSFLISNDSSDIGDFIRMYGKSSSNINVTGLIPLAKELNKKFLTMGKIN